jgi:hypothetical protein
MIKLIAIAISVYSDSGLNTLHNCERDINEIIGHLTENYIIDDVELLTGVTQTTRKYLFNRLQELFINSHEDDSILLVYAGHGEFNHISKVAYWLPSDAQSDDVSTWLGIYDVLSFMKAAKARHISLVSDSCFSGAIVSTRGGGYSALSEKRSRLALTSGGIEKVSDGVKGSLSPFTKTLVDVLLENKEEKVTFWSLAERVIIKFSIDKLQTPAFGFLNDTGHEGGSFVFCRREQPEILYPYKMEEYSLDLNLGLGLKTMSECTLPLFTTAKYFDVRFVNSAIQSVAFNVFSDLRKLVIEDKEFLTGSKLQIGVEMSYNISLLNSDCLSMSIVATQHFGGPHPNIFIHSLNIQFAPERYLRLNDVVEMGNFQNELLHLYRKYGLGEYVDDVAHHLQYITANELDFTFDDDNVYFYLGNLMPYVIRSVGYFSVPRTELKMKL